MLVSLADVARAIVSGVLIGSVYSLIAMGLALIWGVMDIINFAQGDFMMLGAFTTYWLLELAGLDPLLSLPVSFALVFALGVLTQRVVIERILQAPMVSQISATFAVLMMIRYGAEAAFGPFTRRVVTSYTGTVLRFSWTTIPLTRAIAFSISLVVAALLYLFLTRTYVGLAIRATSQNRMAASLMGIDIRRMYMLAFGIGVGVSAVGGTLLSTFFPIYPEMGGFFCLIAFIIVVFGGFGSIFGAYISGIIIGVTEAVSALFISPTLKDVVAFLLFIIIILVKPRGLFGARM
ncbi:MAG: branched-chain amino acid ABC transporter permease [Thermoproteota archaeon]|nr:MAG: branched-chain amino acid ABC transporter permease [Candidatus Korarchaeota archaeon]RLG53940.1 MAG: branched-chain amino acid ABC transporter permease [Candidatus Korarchaeota archaeon]